MLRDFLQDSWTFQETLEEGREQGRKQGLEQGREQGHEQGVRQSIEALVLARFPVLLSAIKGLIASQKDLAALQEILVHVGTASTEDEIKQFLAVPR